MFLSLIADRIIAPVFRVSVEVIVVLDHYVVMATKTFVRMVVFASKYLTNSLKSLFFTAVFCLSVVTLTRKEKETKIFQHIPGKTFHEK